jgi:nitroreductase
MIMDVLEAINTRRSIRKFTGEVISDEEIKTILKAGFQAPSAHNRQPREFIVLKDKEILEAIPKFHQYTKMLPKAGCGIVVCGDMNVQPEFGFLVSDCSASLENILLAAHGLGLGAVWCGIYPIENLMESTSKLLNLPDNIVPIGLVAIGKKEQEVEPKDRYNESKVHYDRW